MLVRPPTAARYFSVDSGLKLAFHVFVIIVLFPSAWGAITLDQTKSTDRSSAATSVTSPSFSTTSASELLLAFISSDAKSAGISVTGVTGANLTWAFVTRTNAQLGTAEVWRAFAPTTLSAATVTATLSQSVVSSITVMSFAGVDASGTNGSGAIGMVGTGNGNPGAPTATLLSTRSGSMVLGVGNDWDNAVGRTVGPGQTLVHQDLAPVGDTYWVQMQSNPIPLSGTSVTINDTAPTSDRYNLSTVEVLASLSQVPVPDLTINKTHSGNFAQGQTSAIYSITATNSGGAPSSGTVTITDALPAGLTATAMSGTNWNCTLSTLTCNRSDALAAGASYSAITLTVNVAGNAPASVTNTATVAGGGETNQTNDTASDVTTVTAAGSPDLTIGKTHSGNFVQGQTGATYAITAKNSGGASSSGTVTVTDTLPAGLTATTLSGTNWNCTLSTLTCSRSDALAAGASYPSITLTVNVASNAPTSVTNTATVSGGGETNQTNDTASDVTTVAAAGSPDLTISKTHSGNFVQGQAGATYSITAKNSGSASSSGTVTVTDTLPVGLSVTAISGTNWNCTLSTVTCTRSDALAAGASYAAITLTVNVAGNAPASITNTATVSGGGETNQSNDTASDITSITAGNGLRHVGGAAGHPVVTSQVMTFSYTPVGTNDALVVLVACISPTVNSISLTAPGWTFTPISGSVGPSWNNDFIGTFGAIAPNTNPVTLTATLPGSNCSPDTAVLVDEFAGNDTTGGTTTFDAHNESLDPAPSGTCTGAPVTPANNNDALWYACFDNVSAVSGGYTKGQDDTAGDWSEYKILSGGSGVAQNAGFVSGGTTFAMGGVSIKAASAPDLTVSKTHSGNFIQGQTGATYSIVVTNRGGTSAAGTVTLTDTLPAGLTPTAIAGTNWVCTLSTLTCTRGDALAAGASYPSITLTVNVASNAPASVTNVATVSGGGETNTGNDTASDVTVIASTTQTLPKLIQSNVKGNESGTASMSVSFTSNNAPADFLIVTGTAARPASTISVSDTLNNSYSLAIGPLTDPTQDVTVYVWYVANCKGGANTVTITPSGTAALEVHVSEWSGIAAVSPLDQTAFATGTGTTVSSGAKVTTLNGELVFGYGWVFNTANAGSGFTPISLVNGDLDEYQLQTTAGSVSASFTQTSGTWFALMCTFKPVGGSGPNSWNLSGTVSPVTGGSGATVNLSGSSSATAIADSSGNYMFTGLSNGSYTVTPSNPGYSFQPASQPVPITDGNSTGINFVASPVPTVLSVSPAGLYFVGNQAGSNPTPGTVNVANTGGGPASFTATSDSTWLTVVPTNGSVPQALQVSANIGGLALGSYTGHITIAPSNTQGSAVTVNVTLNVGMATDWLTVDHDSSRSGNAVDETTLTTSNVGNLQLNWSTKVDGNITAQPLYVHALQIAGQVRDVLIVGTGGNSIYAFDASNGSVLWTRNFGAPTPNTWGLPDGFGIEAPPVIDRVTERIYTVSTDGDFRTISLVDGTDVYPAFSLLVNPVTNKVWGGLNRVGNSIYVASASNGGDVSPWRGQVYQIDVTSAPALVGNFVVVPSIPAPNGGGGIWGYGGVSADPANGNIYTTTSFDSNVSNNGNENTAIYSNSVIALNSSLNLLGYFQGPKPSTIPCGGAPCDLDFASTPTVFQPTGCPTMTAGGSKNGNLYLFRTADLIAGGQPLQILAMNAPEDSLGSGGVGGVPAWSAANNMLYITDAGPGVTGIAAGVVALKATNSCTLQVAWSNALGGNDTPNSTPTIANGVVFVGQGNSGAVHAYDALTGTPLWQSGSQFVAAGTFAAPTVAGGKLYVGSWTTLGGGGTVGSFSLPDTTNPVLSVSPQTVSFNSLVGGSNPAPANINVTNTGVGTLTFTANSDSAWLSVSPTSGTAPQSIQASASITGLSAGTYTGHITVSATGAQGSPSVVTVTLTLSSVGSTLAIDANIPKDNPSASKTIVTQAFSTGSGNELLLAFISTDFISGANTTVTGVSGGGLVWEFVVRANGQSGTSEIWRAFSASPLTNVAVTATLSQSVLSSMTIMSFTGVDTTGTNGSGAIGAKNNVSARSGAPSATLTTTRNNSWVFGVGNDYDNALARMAGAGQSLVHQDFAAVGDTYWVQMQNAPTPFSGTSVSISDIAPTGDRYNLAICEVLPAPR